MPSTELDSLAAKKVHGRGWGECSRKGERNTKCCYIKRDVFIYFLMRQQITKRFLKKSCYLAHICDYSISNFYCLLMTITLLTVCRTECCGWKDQSVKITVRRLLSESEREDAAAA